MIPNTATSLWFSVSSTFTIASPCSIDAIRAESSPMRCWRNVASLAGGPCACKGMTAVAAPPASAMEPRSITDRVARACLVLRPHERAEFERSHEQRDTSHDREAGDQSHDRGERDRGGEQREHRRDDAQDAERRRPAPRDPHIFLLERRIDAEDTGKQQPPGDPYHREAQREHRVVDECCDPEPDAHQP